MSFDEKLAERVRQITFARLGISEKKMFGGLAFLLDGKMFCGIVRDELMVRVGPERYEACLAEPYARPMDFTGRPMKGFVFVGPKGYRTSKTLRIWVGRGLDFLSDTLGNKNERTVSNRAVAKRPATRDRSRRPLRRPTHPMEDFVSAALQRNKLMDAYAARPRYQQNDYLGWINCAKRQQTKDRRLKQMLDELRRGDQYMKMAWHPSSRSR